MLERLTQNQQNDLRDLCLQQRRNNISLFVLGRRLETQTAAHAGVCVCVIEVDCGVHHMVA